MIHRSLLSIAAALALALGASAAMADGKKDCTTADKATWKPQAEAEAAAKPAGYEVRRSKIDGNCYEVHAVKDSKNLELFYDSVSLKLVGARLGRSCSPLPLVARWPGGDGVDQRRHRRSPARDRRLCGRRADRVSLGLGLGYIADIARMQPKHYVGHNPAGAAMIVALLGVLVTISVTGVMM
jgi:hypothetical protein